jgi:hypothetical protein
MFAAGEEGPRGGPTLLTFTVNYDRYIYCIRRTVCRLQFASMLAFLAPRRANFSSVRANVCIVKGQWMWEAQLGSDGIMQLGWCTLSSKFTSEEGVGDSPNSFAYDGKRQRRWNVSQQPYGERWTAGDIIGCCLDMDSQTMTFFRNGVSLGIAFTGVGYSRSHRTATGVAYFPGASLSYGESCQFNFGARPFIYPVEGYAPLQAPPPNVRAGQYLVGCMSRLLDVTSEGAGAGTPRAAAALAAWRAMPEGEGEDTAAGNGNHNEGKPGEARAPATSGSGRRKGAADHYSNCAIDDNDVVLFTALLASRLGPMCFSEYEACAVLVPLLRNTYFGPRGAASSESSEELSRLLDLLSATLEQEELVALAAAAAAAQGRAVRGCVWSADEFPGSEAARTLEFWCAALDCELFRRAWLSDTSWWSHTESLLTIRRPTSGDLASVPPQVAWDADEDHSMVLRMARGSDAMVELRVLEAAIGRVEAAQVALLLRVWLHQDNRGRVEKPGAKSSEAEAAIERDEEASLDEVQSQATLSHEEETASNVLSPRMQVVSAVACLAEVDPPGVSPLITDFLAFLIDKNRGATRNVPPPGLSDPTALVSTLYAMLRLLAPQLREVHEGGAGFSWPTVGFFLGLPGTETDDPYHDTSRLGGTLSHLAREHFPDATADLRPVEVPAAAARGPWIAEPPAPPAVPQLTEWAWWAWDRMLMLHHLAVAAVMRQGLGHLHVMEQALTTLQAINTR